jgi:hypothetical protein
MDIVDSYSGLKCKSVTRERFERKQEWLTRRQAYHRGVSVEDLTEIRKNCQDSWFWPRFGRFTSRLQVICITA